MEFCPTCGNMLLYELPNTGHSARFFCPTCPYVCQIEKRVKIKRHMRLVKKAVDPIFSENDQQNLPTTDTTCPACNYGKAAFYQVQIRSADEPMTTFYICKRETCRNHWRED
ncbi:DNA-directed RNA polymerase III subunit RPC10-like [Olea europaea var. sylvestris]|uniref:DNA-directed RNA polymerase subunit n=1 Tax=Olea europaea subsp. europaea TaxID=158383 RepID=A0A8S0QA37_OLEEU|nr:DNA-directed RNA polymerase III subunit RPC10-like [Olea europaea var. sylvestris]XP_022895828.1 DNA-directed RNA polymerase III subunit RPC10-like [Olea europaea var. sylvestris]XP_022895829.1 DNA-directed RNA polymerase III subunit RPC10-like [Olea europaea var. sylvestris]XP_022895830.1 DNA-directed RNA polymerase III subunit RPC10-like [Olea europaea var. sylvestris]CAA2965327.1 DNA-directed RNA polymerase III subunit RPC10-like [Olea europaea subsp. europaea]